MRPRIDHYAYGVTSRDDIIETVVYVQTAVQRLIPHLKKGDRIRIQRDGKTYPQIELTVVNGHGEYLEVRDEDGLLYKLWGSWEHHFNEWPWLRRDGESAGRIRSLTILELPNHE